MYPVQKFCPGAAIKWSQSHKNQVLMFHNTVDTKQGFPKRLGPLPPFRIERKKSGRMRVPEKPRCISADESSLPVFLALLALLERHSSRGILCLCTLPSAWDPPGGCLKLTPYFATVGMCTCHAHFGQPVLARFIR